MSGGDKKRMTVPTTSVADDVAATDVGHAATTPVDAGLDATVPGNLRAAQVAHDATMPSTIPPGAPADPLIGTSIGRYRVIERVGAGGMGVVYRALDPALDRTVALKVLPPLAAAQRLNLEERLRREAQALARVDHEHVIAVYDVGLAAASLFVAMQFIDGTTLDHYLTERRPGPRQILALFVAAGRGLAAAHAANIVHRDVKPSNVLVDRAGHAYIGDFGLARAAGDLDVTETSADDLLGAEMTRAGAILGTPLFMAPEQHRGEPATPRSDQYSFCLSVWHGLFGRHPFVATRWSRVDTIAAMEADRIVEPPRAPKVSARVLRALRRGLRHDPAARWPSMTALLAELEPPSRTAWVLGGLTGAGLIGGAVVMVIVGNVVEDRDPCGNAADRLATIATPERARALADGFAATRLSYATATATRVEAALTDYGARWSAMRIDACRANRVRHDQSDDLFDRRVTCLDERLVALDSALGVLSGQPTAEVVDRAIQVADNLPKLDDCADSARLAALMPEPTDPTRRAAIDRTSAAVAQAEAELEAGHGAHSVATAAQLVADARAIGWAPLTQKALMLAGGADADAGDQDAAVAHFRGASLEAGRAHDDLGAAGALATIARIIADTGKADDALVVLTDAEVLAERIGDPPRLRGEIEEARAIALGNLSRYPESMAAFTKAIALARAAQPRDELWLARVLLAHADVRKGAGDFDAARAAATEAQAIFERVLGPDHPLLVPVHQTLGNIAFQQKQLDVGKAEYAREFAILRARYSETNPRFADAHFNSAMVALHENVLEVAATEFDAARQAYARLAPDHPNTDKARYMLAVTRMFQDKLDEAAALFEESLAYRRAKFGNAALPTADVLDALGQAYAQQHDLAHAMTVRTEALKIREQVLGPNHADVADSLQNLSSLAMDRGDCGQAIALAVRAIAILDRIDGASARTVPALGVLGSCEVRVGKIHDGLAHLAKALTLVEIPGNGDVDQRTTVRTSYGDALWNHGDRAQARALFLEARKLFADADRAADVADTQKWLDAHPAR